MSTQEQESADERSFNWKVAFILLAIFLVGLASFWVGIADRVRIGRPNEWSITKANVIDVSVHEASNPDYETYRDQDGGTRVVDSSEPRRINVLMVEYEFAKGSKRYSGSGSLGRYHGGTRTVTKSVAPQQVTVYYKRSMPADNSMIDPKDYRRSAWVPIILGLVFMLLPSAAAFLWYRIETSDWEPPQGKFDPGNSSLEIRNQED
jgi:hypothetical protein